MKPHRHHSRYKGYAVVVKAFSTNKWPTDQKGRLRFIPGSTIKIRLGFFSPFTPEKRKEAVAYLKQVTDRCESSFLLQEPTLVKCKTVPKAGTIFRAIEGSKLKKS